MSLRPTSISRSRDVNGDGQRLHFVKRIRGAARRRDAIMTAQWGHQLAEQRRRLGFTQAGLAEIMGVTPNRISQIEHGEVSTVEALAGYVAALGDKLELTADIGGQLLNMPVNRTYEFQVSEASSRP